MSFVLYGLTTSYEILPVWGAFWGLRENVGNARPPPCRLVMFRFET